MHKRMLIPTIVMLLTASAWSVQPGQWSHSSEADFLPADRDATVINNHGDILLARQIDILLSSDDAPAVISAVVHRDGQTYAASGTDGRIFRIGKDGKSETFATLPAGMVTAMTFRGQTLLVGGGGEQAGVYVVSPDGESRLLFSDDDVTYVWAIVAADNNTLYAATGPNARVYRVDAKGKGEVILDAGEVANNILCLADGGENVLYAGTDEKGLVFHIDVKAKKGRVILDAAENEVAAIVLDGAGGIYAATSDAAKATGDAPTGGKTGRADLPIEADGEPVGDDEPIPAEDDAAEDADTSDSVEASKTEQVPTDADADQQAAPTEPVEKVDDVEIDIEADVDVDVPADTDEETMATRVAASNGGNGGGSANGNGETAAAPSGNGNAVYRVDAEGYVHTIFRRPVVIHAMIAHGDRLVLATGNDGVVHYVSTDGSRRGQLVDTEAAQVTCLADTPDGEILFGTAGEGSVGRIGSKFARQGTLTCKPLDAGQIARWGTVRLTGQTPEGTTLTIATRSGNLAEPTDATWSSWSKEQPLTEGFAAIGSPAGRFLQYRITMTSDAQRSPSLGSVRLIYQVGNLAPIVSALEVSASDTGSTQQQTSPTKHYRQVKITAADPNKDELTFRIAYRVIGNDAWVEITEDLDKPEFVWDTRAVADGRYELRITASDQPSNIAPQAKTGSRLSEPITVDNTAPQLKDLTARLNGKTATVSGKTLDALSRITALAYSVDSVDEWHVVLPTDNICDSNEEAFRFDIKDLPPGPHQITVRAVDAYDNTGYAGTQVTVAKP